MILDKLEFSHITKQLFNKNLPLRFVLGQNMMEDGIRINAKNDKIK